MTREARRRSATVADVAAAAGVSKAQAARALGSYGQVSQAVRDKVQKAAKDLGFRRNRLAATMTTGRSNILGVVVSEIENPHFGLAVRGMSDTARAAGYDLMLLNTDENVEAEVDAVRVLTEKQVDGLIVTPSFPGRTEHLQEVIDLGIPLVQFDRQIKDLDAEAVTVDFSAATSAAIEELIRTGHRRVAYLSSLDWDEPFDWDADLDGAPVRQRIHGLHQAFVIHGLEADPALIRFNARSSAAVSAIVDDLLSGDPPTAFVASDSLIAQRLLGELARRAVRIPDDVSFLMYDDFEWTTLISPRLTVIAQPVYAAGARAAAKLIAQISGTPGTTEEPLEATLIRRDSIGPVAVAAHSG
ncbi:LacI family DNA-binding transcriptional regulator [Brevibacterium sp.]|uniref:LacI family DNA-binding transcriptional regulator n=1 Tax=Brevibacterium sp. TaxID=1701 RepID=UPI002810F72D|nr:LacI family DNA-binding transcriptional regulator [Brevibacterium sp.]